MSMSNVKQALIDLRIAERHLIRALKQVGMERGKEGFIAPPIAVALENLRKAVNNIDSPRTRKRTWSRLARR